MRSMIIMMEIVLQLNKIIEIPMKDRYKKILKRHLRIYRIDNGSIKSRKCVVRTELLKSFRYTEWSKF